MHFALKKAQLTQFFIFIKYNYKINFIRHLLKKKVHKIYRIGTLKIASHLSDKKSEYGVC
jgi:hypothetical protein